MKHLHFFGVVALMLLLAACDRDYGDYMGGWGHMMPYGYGGIFMWVLFLIILVVIIYGISRGGYSSGKSGPTGETPLEILKKRYAKGEITKDQFDQMKNDLGS
ncbi:MAG: SHOCT domain-containing protein [Syntrophales bacterium]